MKYEVSLSRICKSLSSPTIKMRVGISNFFNVPSLRIDRYSSSRTPHKANRAIWCNDAHVPAFMLGKTYNRTAFVRIRFHSRALTRELLSVKLPV